MVIQPVVLKSQVMTDGELTRLFDILRQDVRGEIGSLRVENATFREELRGENATFREEVRAENAAFRQESAAAHAETRRMLYSAIQDLREENTALHAHTRYQFDLTAEDLRHEIRLVAEGVQNVDQRLTREAGDIREEMRHGFAEVHAALKYSHGELDRRIRVLEER